MSEGAFGAASGGASGGGRNGLPVEVRDLEKVFWDEGRGEVRAVDGVDFECRKGEIFGLLGANGAGKTTTLRMLATILRPTRGTARVMGHEVTEEPEAVRRSLGFHSASTALYPRLTARETLDFFARINGYPRKRIRERVDELVDRFGIREYQDARVEKLSSGMKQKVSIARTVAHDPPVLILDEPTLGLDIMTARSILDFILDAKARGHCVIFSTHYMTEAELLCDRIGLIHGGRLLDEGPPAALRGEEDSLEAAFLARVQGDPADDAPAGQGDRLAVDAGDVP